MIQEANTVQEPSLYGHTVQGTVHADPTLFQWVELFKEFWPGLVLLGSAYIGYLGLKVKKGVDNRNRQRLIDLAKQDREDEYEDETVTGYLFDKARGKDK